MLSSRERVHVALSHKEADRIPLDLGGTPVTGMNISVVYELRQAMKLDAPHTPIKVIEPYQMLGEIKPDIMDAIGIDTVALNRNRTKFGYKNENWKQWDGYHDIPVLVPQSFNTEMDKDGNVLMYPQGDKTVAPSGIMPKDGWYFDTLIRQQPIDENNLHIEDNLEEFGSLSDEEVNHFMSEAKRLYKETDKAIIANFGGTSFGDIALVPAPQLKSPKGIRDIEEWYVSYNKRKDYIVSVFERQCDIALNNYEILRQVVGEYITAVYVTGTDFGAQAGLLISPETYHKLFYPFHKRVNDWVHENTNWKTFIHSCGSVANLLSSFIDAGFDILNPVQCSASGMEPSLLKKTYGNRITFWGGGVDTQKTLPFGTIEEVREEVINRIKVFGHGGGFVFNAIHNIQPQTPVENVLTLLETFKNHSSYPLV